MAISDFLIPRFAAGGLEITDYAVRAVTLAKKNGKTVIGKRAAMTLPAGTISSGKVLDAEKLTRTLKKLATEAGLTRKFVVVTLSESNFFTQIFRLQSMPDEKIGEFLELNTPTSLPFPKDDLMIGWHDISAGSLASQKELFLVTASKSGIMSYAEAISNAGMTPLAVESTSISLARLVPPAAERQLLVFLRHREAVYSILENGIGTFSLSTKSGLDRFLKTNTDGTDVAITPAAVETFAGELTAEIARVLRFQGQGLKTICYGSDVKLPALPKLIGLVTKLTVKELALPTGFEADIASEPFVLPVLGAAYRGFNISEQDRDVSMLPYSARIFYRYRRAQMLMRSLFNISYISAAAIALFLLAGLLVLNYQRSALSSRAKTTVLSKADRDALAQIKTADGLIEQMKGIYQATSVWSGALPEITPAVSGVRYTGYSVTNLTRAVTVSGFADTLDHFNALLQQYRSDTDLENINVPPDILGQDHNITFTLTFSIKAAKVKAS